MGLVCLSTHQRTHLFHVDLYRLPVPGAHACEMNFLASCESQPSCQRDRKSSKPPEVGGLEGPGDERVPQGPGELWENPEGGLDNRIRAPEVMETTPGTSKEGLLAPRSRLHDIPGLILLRSEGTEETYTPDAVPCPARTRPPPLPPDPGAS
ncbi:hypothetical protein NDU88_001818 [Pleurodeles waltl]|uniref:Uncharacterized protein n=1 Tax=Pleurodeles waltl TaxID=8319 RepID=A0AAV7KTV3_PLEWA|nr:hypothetical protein NDU88_001818 [Pleurodeles waltl]